MGQKNALRMAPSPSRQQERRAARDFLVTLLRNGPVPAAEVLAQARAARVPVKYLREAARGLRVELVKSGFGASGYWSWRLPTRAA